MSDPKPPIPSEPNDPTAVPSDPTPVPVPSRDAETKRKNKIEDLIDQMHAALIHVRREWRYHGESAALVSFVHTLLIATTALDSIIELVRTKVDPASLTSLETFRKDATILLEDLRNLVHRLPEGGGEGT